MVTWHARNTGPGIDGYDVQYRKGGGSWSVDNCRDVTATSNCNGITDTDTTITGLEEDTSYSVQVRAKNDEGTSGLVIRSHVEDQPGHERSADIH